MKLYSFTATVLAFCIFLISSPVSACAQPSCHLKNITSNIKSQASLHEFTQEKSIQVLANPLKSSGYLLLADNETVVWQTTTPIKSTTVISATEFKQFNKNDQPITMPSSADTQTSQLISSTFLAILSGNLDSLNDNFEVTSLCNDSGWDLNLEPTNSRIQRLIKQIHIRGSQQIDQLDFTESNGDITSIVFSATNSQQTEKQLGTYLVD
ncbi:outer membrane lipoprotein carrier protein LolA [Kangiella sp. HD9-110m-PIT-SAG07]|nr:outer membrane lipoprotein carrier protein LolA [Kangiella sp. HD9-110m-PIT-SAG07]